MHAKLILVGMLLLSPGFVASTNAPDPKQYSYVCLESDQDLCLGVSPGPADPFFDPNNLFYLQVKSRSRNEDQMLDYKKLRWDLSYGQGKVSLSRFKDLCAVKRGGLDEAALFPCNQTFPQRYSGRDNYGRFNLQNLKSTPNGEGTMMLAGSSGLCLTAMRCEGIAGEDYEYCDRLSKKVAWTNDNGGSVIDLRRGSYLKFRPCYNQGGEAGWKAVQVWRQRLDCTTGCPPMLQDNNVCDAVCNVAQCGFDNGRCGPATKSPTRTPTPPTPPTTKTLSPTRAPTTPTPPTALSPTFKSPTSTPTTPTSNTKSPVRAPTTLIPTTFAPSISPSVACPITNDVAVCKRFSNRQCRRNKNARRLCRVCTGACRPKSEPRLCEAPGLYDHCLPVCPSTELRNKCAAKTGAKCNVDRTCSWCGPVLRCQPGSDKRVCTVPNFYSYCPTSG